MKTTELVIGESAKRWSSWTWLVNSGKKHSYQGTVSATEVARRRAANKAARIARRKNR